MIYHYQNLKKSGFLGLINKNLFQSWKINFFFFSWKFGVIQLPTVSTSQKLMYTFINLCVHNHSYLLLSRCACPEWYIAWALCWDWPTHAIKGRSTSNYSYFHMCLFVIFWVGFFERNKTVLSVLFLACICGLFMTKIDSTQ